MSNALELATNTQAGIEVIEQFYNVPKLDLGLEGHVSALFARYCANELEATRRLYQKAKDRPPSPWHMPPVAGAIAWARQLLHVVETPMAFFRTRAEICEAPDKAVDLQHYNILALNLVEYELLWHDHWVASVRQIGQAMQTPLLAMDEGGRICVNLDPGLDALVQEVAWMEKLELHVPSEAIFLASKCQKIKPIQNRLLAVLDRHRVLKTLCQEDSPLRNAVALLVSTLDQALQPGFRLLTWSVDGAERKRVHWIWRLGNADYFVRSLLALLG